MNVFKNDCPYCGIKSVAFTILHEELWSKSPLPPPGSGDYIYGWDAFAKCGHCGRGIIATFKTLTERPPTKQQGEARFFKLVEIAPQLPKNSAPEHTPENVARFFEQAMDNLPNNWDAAGGMFRKALDTGLKSKFPDIKGKLSTRIKQAAAEQHLTSELAEWAHQIRLDGNDAAHGEEPFSKDDAKRLSQFTHLVFLYLFELPGMLDKSQNKTRKDG